VSTPSGIVVVAGPGAPQDVAALRGWSGVAEWDAARVEREGSLDAACRLVLLFVDAPAETQKRWLAALGRGAGPETVVAIYNPRLSVSELAAAHPQPQQVVGFDFLEGRLAPGNLVEVAPGLRTAPAAAAAVEGFFKENGLETERVGDYSGLVMRRILYMLINEAAYALMEGVASHGDIDAGMKLGTGYPAGPLEWADTIGLDRVYDGLRSLHEEYGDDRYRPCPLLRKMVAAGLTGKRAGAGFHRYTAQERSGS
jgi:3-hydroxybutyryl-CoA dehydrogenase